MNIHHLELFYYVARHGGIMGAVRNIPYGIQQPAVSGQVAQLEEFLGVTLFQRRPFELTTEGKKLYTFIEPFFSNLDRVASELQGGQTRQIRIGASAIILRDYMPAIIRSLKQSQAGISISLQDGYPMELEDRLIRNELDVAVTVLGGKTPTGLKSTALLELPLVLLVPQSSHLRDASELWQRDKIEDSLICLPDHELLCRTFQEKLRRMRIDWFAGIEAASLELVERYVASGLGIGLSIGMPRQALPKDVRILPLRDFPPLRLGALWRGKPSRAIEALVAELRAIAKGIAFG